MHQDWDTQNIVITGAASGLGQAICAHFLHLGAGVRGIDVNEAPLKEMQTSLGKNFIPVICDVTIWQEVEHTFQRFPPVDVLVNCAGITGKTDVKSEETDPADVERVFRVNFFGSYHTSKTVLPQMVKRGYGRLLHIASISGKEGNAGMLAYSASKAAVIAMTRWVGADRWTRSSRWLSLSFHRAAALPPGSRLISPEVELLIERSSDFSAHHTDLFFSVAATVHAHSFKEAGRKGDEICRRDLPITVGRKPRRA